MTTMKLRQGALSILCTLIVGSSVPSGNLMLAGVGVGSRKAMSAAQNGARASGWGARSGNMPVPPAVSPSRSVGGAASTGFDSEAAFIASVVSVAEKYGKDGILPKGMCALFDWPTDRPVTARYMVIPDKDSWRKSVRVRYLDKDHQEVIFGATNDEAGEMRLLLSSSAGELLRAFYIKAGQKGQEIPNKFAQGEFLAQKKAWIEYVRETQIQSSGGGSR